MRLTNKNNSHPQSTGSYDTRTLHRNPGVNGENRVH